jgi:hypothetical protein
MSPFPPHLFLLFPNSENMLVLSSSPLHRQPDSGDHAGVVEGAVSLSPASASASASGDTIRISYENPVMFPWQSYIMSPWLSMSPPHQVPLPVYTNKVPIDGLQFVIPQVREAAPAHFEGADMPLGKSFSQQFVFVAEETNIKLCVMRHKDAVPDEGVQRREDFFRRRLPDEHLIGNAVNLRRTKGNRPRRLNQGAEFGH